MPPSAGEEQSFIGLERGLLVRAEGLCEGSVSRTSVQISVAASVHMSSAEERWLLLAADDLGTVQSDAYLSFPLTGRNTECDDPHVPCLG